jgi:hypothetical protein
MPPFSDTSFTAIASCPIMSLLLETETAHLSKIMQRLLTAYTLYFEPLAKLSVIPEYGYLLDSTDHNI